ncbi:hypothetical protein VP10329_05962 [Vibrio parahaemolyticus 10329]|nr:hypothetical protein VP10329_05962 [Vibrio parahaemolyticus 10329]
MAVLLRRVDDGSKAVCSRVKGDGDAAAESVAPDDLQDDCGAYCPVE